MRTLWRVNEIGQLEQMDIWVDGQMIMTRTGPLGGPPGVQQGWDDERAYEDLGGPEGAMDDFVASMKDGDGWAEELDDIQYEYEMQCCEAPNWDLGKLHVWEVNEVVVFCFRCGARVHHHEWYKPADDPTEMPVLFSCSSCGLKVATFDVDWDE